MTFNQLRKLCKENKDVRDAWYWGLGVGYFIGASVVLIIRN